MGYCYMKPSLLNYLAPFVYDVKSGLFKTDDGRLLSYKEAVKLKWKCDKCVKTFQNYRLLKIHRINSHSY